METSQNESIILTIAVPVYNVGKYLDRCLESLVTQKFYNKEILIVNDGSTDNSLDIIKKYANKYSFVRYIDQLNEGLAAVRNRCIKEAKGRYISFIDSDDYVLEDTYTHLMPYIIENDIDIMCFGVINIYENKNNKTIIQNINDKDEIIKIFTKEQALDEFLLPNNIDVITCNKIIKKEIYKGIEYPIGKLYEDMFTNYKLIMNAKNIASTNYSYYVYCHRESSIGGMKYNEKTMDLYRAVTEVYEYALIEGLNKPIHLNVGYATWLIVVLNIMIRSNHSDEQYKIEVMNFIKSHIDEINNSTYLNLTRKIQMNLLIRSFDLYRLAYKCYLARNRQ